MVKSNFKGKRKPPPGRRAGYGRQKGTPNKVTGQARAMFAAFVDNAAPQIEELWEQVARGRSYKQGSKTVKVPADPAQALNILGRLSEYVIPRLNRTEVTGADGAALVPPNIGISFGHGGPSYGGGDAAAETEDTEPAAGTASEGAVESEAAGSILPPGSESDR